ncbi:hypothetical protein FHX37_0943 [Haloactinospora alba]|uniref:Uncharacterized protein n=1 Tax=Haloactinospora alba TaxID=405555 RepID=A0A543NGY8_9ACTN|nr:hypothetical protein [Haloactinospora alba]TQN31054.1 hypothetical protein FHX37_0943 [Haloactinospora alba]
MKWLLKRILAGFAALVIVAAGAGVLLWTQFLGETEPWAVSQGNNAAWLSGAWVSGERSRDDFADLLPRIREGEIGELYVHVGELTPEGELPPGNYARAEEFLAWTEQEIPDVDVLGWVSRTADSSSMTEDRFTPQQRAAVARSAAEVHDTGFDGVHLAVRPVTTNDPSLPDTVERVRREIGDDATLSVQAQHVELLTGIRLPAFALSRSERFWSTGYVKRVSEHADTVVLPGHGTGMPTSQLYGGFMVRQVEESLETLEEGDTALRFGAPSYSEERWGDASAAENVGTAAEAVRVGMSSYGERDDVGLALYVLDDTGDEDWETFVDTWVDP